MARHRRKKIYVFIPKRLKGGLFRGGANGSAEGIIMNLANPLAQSQPVTKENAPVVPSWANSAQVPIPVEQRAAEILRKNGFSGNVKQISVPSDDERVQEILRKYDLPGARKKTTPSFSSTASSAFNRIIDVGQNSGVNFNALAGLMLNTFRDYLVESAWKNEPWYKKALYYPTAFASSFFDNNLQNLFGQQPIANKQNFLQQASPVIGTIANAFLPGTGTLLRTGLSALGSLFGRGRRGGRVKRGKKPKKSIFVFNNGTRQYLGSKVEFKKDLEKTSEEAFRNKAEDARWRKLISSAFTSAINKVAPAIGSGKFILGRKIKKSKVIKMGGTAADKAHMEWVRSFKKKKRGKGGRFKYVEIRSGKNLFGKGVRKRKSKRKHKRGGSKYKYYRTHALIYPKIQRKKKRGKGLASSGVYGRGDPRNPSGWFSY